MNVPWLKQKPTIRFAATQGAPQVSELTCIRKASDVKPKWLRDQRDVDNKLKFVNCPGMSDMMQAGYIIPAWTDITIKANGAGTVVKGAEPFPMNYELVRGMAPIEDSVRGLVHKIAMPWAAFTRPGYSAQVIGAPMHAPELKDLYIYPGIVDYDKFTTCNFIFSAIRECEVFIPAGTPLLQVIPFKREPVTATFGPATRWEMDFFKHGFPTKVQAAYRKYFHARKSFALKGDIYD